MTVSRLKPNIALYFRARTIKPLSGTTGNEDKKAVTGGESAVRAGGSSGWSVDRSRGGEGAADKRSIITEPVRAATATIPHEIFN